MPQALHYLLELSNYSFSKGFKLCPLSKTNTLTNFKRCGMEVNLLASQAVHRQKDGIDCACGSVLPQGSAASELQPTELHQISPLLGAPK